MRTKSKPADVAAYIAAAPPAARVMLKQLRAAIRAAAPQAQETLSYGMPYYARHGRLAYFAAFRDHVSYFVMSSRAIDAKYGAALAPYRKTKATLHFPLGTKLPLALIRNVVKARAKENEAKAAAAPSRAAAAKRSGTRPRRATAAIAPRTGTRRSRRRTRS